MRWDNLTLETTKRLREAEYDLAFRSPFANYTNSEKRIRLTRLCEVRVELRKSYRR